MIGHLLNMYVLAGDMNVDWKDNRLNVMITADRWHYATGRDIEFIAVGLPEQFAFIVQEDSVLVGDGLVRNGDCRQGSWAGIASKIGVNKYQGIQSTGVANLASGMIGFGNSTRVGYNKMLGTETRGTGRTTLGGRSDFALGSSYAKNVLTPSGNGVQIRLPYYCDPEYDWAPATLSRLQFGDAVDSDSRTLRKTPAEARVEFFKRTGAVGTTNFTSYGSNYIGGITHLANNSIYMVAPKPYYDMTMQYVPQTEAGVGETVVGNRGRVVWRRWLVAGSTKVRPFTAFALGMDVNADGTFSYFRNVKLNPNPNGVDFYPDSFTFFSDTQSDTDDNTLNRTILKDAYLASQSKSTAYTVKYPISVPTKFRKGRYIKGTGADMPLTNVWTTEADFINHTYTIGGE